MGIRSYSFARPGNRTSTTRTCTRNTGILCARVNDFPLQPVLLYLRCGQGPNEVMIRDPAAILPLMGTSGWGKSTCESLRTAGGPFTDVSMVRLVGSADVRPHPSTDRSARRSRTRETPPNLEPRFQPCVYARIRTDGARENLGITRNGPPARSSRPL